MEIIDAPGPVLTQTQRIGKHVQCAEEKSISAKNEEGC